jgi:queuine tRNA-ribosyltransferase
MNNKFEFTLKAKENKSRRGIIKTSRGEINTPAFMVVGTAGTVKALTNDDVNKSGTEIILGNI